MVYEKISSSIDKFYNNLALDNKHFRFIDAVISENGEVVIPLLTTFSYVSKGWPDHLWYFDDVWELCDICDSIFPPTLIYAPSTTGREALQEELNKLVSHEYYTVIQYPFPSQPVYYTKASEKIFDYEHYPVFDGSPFYSRLFNHNFPFLYDLGLEMCPLYDSYAGLGFDNCPTGQEIVSWEVEYGQNWNHTKEFHTLKVIYGIRHGDSTPGHTDD